MLPHLGVFTYSTPSVSKRSQAALTSGTDRPICPNPRGVIITTVISAEASIVFRAPVVGQFQ